MKRVILSIAFAATFLSVAQADPGISYQSNNVTIKVDPTQQQQLDMLTNIYEVLKPKEDDEDDNPDINHPSLLDRMESYKGKPPAWMTKKRP